MVRDDFDVASVRADSRFDLVIRALWLLICVVVVFVPVIIIPYAPTLNSAVHSKDLAIRLMLAVMLGLLPLTGTQLLRRRPDLAELGLLGFVAVHWVSSMLSGRLGYCLVEQWQTWGWILIGLLLYRLPLDSGAVTKLTHVIIAGGVVCSVYGLLTYVGADPLSKLYPFLRRPEDGGRNFIHSFLGNPEYFGTYIAPITLLSISRMLGSGVWLWQRGVWLACALLMLMALALSGARGAFLGFGAGLLVVIVVQLPRLEQRFRRLCYGLLGLGAAVTIFGVVLLSFPNGLNPRGMRLIQRFGDVTNLESVSIRERLFFYTITARSIGNNPVWGAGPGTYKIDFFPNLAHLESQDEKAGVRRMAVELQNQLAEHPHSDYLEFWYELGTVGMAILVFFLSAVFWRFVSGIAVLRSERRRLLVLQREGKAVEVSRGSETLSIYACLWAGFFAAFLCLFISAAFSFPLHLPARGSLAWIIAGAFLATDLGLRRLIESGSSAQAG